MSPATRESWGWCSCANRSWYSLQQNLGKLRSLQGELRDLTNSERILRSNFYVKFLNSVIFIIFVALSGTKEQVVQNKNKKRPSRGPTWLQQAIFLSSKACKLSNLTMFFDVLHVHLPKIVSLKSKKKHDRYESIERVESVERSAVVPASLAVPSELLSSSPTHRGWRLGTHCNCQGCWKESSLWNRSVKLLNIKANDMPKPSLLEIKQDLDWQKPLQLQSFRTFWGAKGFEIHWASLTARHSGAWIFSQNMCDQKIGFPLEIVNSCQPRWPSASWRMYTKPRSEWRQTEVKILTVLILFWR